MDQLNRRNFLKIAGAAGVAAIGAGTALANQPGSTENKPGMVSQTLTWQEMDTAHKEVVDIFLANIGKSPEFWGKPLEPEMDGDVKVFKLTCQEVDWEVEPGITAKAMTYNGVVPGPEIRITEGDTIRIEVTNEMTQSTAIHFHGVILPNSQDGVPISL